MVRSVCTVVASDDADDYREVSPSITLPSSSGRQKHRRDVVDWDRDEDEWIMKHMKTQAAIEEKKT